MATAIGIETPGMKYMEFIGYMAGRRGRIWNLEFKSGVATAIRIGAPGISELEFQPVLGRASRSQSDFGIH
jgi:hypothetical protein